MNWDLSLLKKFSSTGHFRLLNQVRNELRKRPIDRTKNIRETRIQNRTSITNFSRINKT